MTTLGPEVVKILGAIESLKGVLEGLPSVEPGSALAVDGEAWPTGPVSAYATTSILSSIEHQLMVRSTLVDALALYPSAIETTLRTALIGAAEACWLLGPDDSDTRVIRGLRIAADDLSDSDGTARDLTTAEAYPADAPVHDLARDRMAQVAAAVDAARRELDRRGFTVSPRRSAISATVMIREALTEAFPGQPMLVYGGMHLWRRGSGKAHARMWPTFIAYDTVAETEATVTVQTTLSSDQLMTGLMPPLQLINRALKLYTLRARA
ncbi:hypothetical protein [Kineosporia sp. A_224]|uniref:hypothetical protein n=1 Tax=Kineosporia sp. A_224 TaxID=1962180 RepID=UPI000B4B7C26|nr:hypothetical protein [Kineosporia sp. A_224]